MTASAPGSGLEWLALALFGVYGLVAFAIRTAVQLRRTGDSGFRGFSGTPATAGWWARVLLVGALATGVLGPVAGLRGLDAIGVLDHGWVHMAGIALAAVGLACTFLTQLVMGDSWRVGVDESEHTALVMTGPFGVVRNPIFTCMLVTGAGLALVVPNLLAVAGWLLLLVAIEVQVRVVEEPYLDRHHGAPYWRYLATVGRFVPRVGLVTAPPTDPPAATPSGSAG